MKSFESYSTGLVFFFASNNIITSDCSESSYELTKKKKKHVHFFSVQILITIIVRLYEKLLDTRVIIDSRSDA